MRLRTNLVKSCSALIRFDTNTSVVGFSYYDNVQYLVLSGLAVMRFERNASLSKLY